MNQKQHLEMENLEIDKTLEELKKTDDENTVYKHTGSILIKSTKKDLIDELEERKELAKTRSTVLEKQEARIKDSLKEQETKITEMMQKPMTGNTAPTKLPEEENPRK
jgi:prefoldin beta subunit